MNSIAISGNKQRYEYIYFLKFIAILLITNSHFKPVYDGTLSQFAFGGAMGCALFFFCSGYTLAYSQFDSFIRWMGKRIIRIYPTLWLVNILSTCTGKSVQWYDYLFPQNQNYWFLQAILVFYVLYYLVMKYAKAYLKLVIACLIVPFVLTYAISENHTWIIDYAAQPNRLHWYFYFAIMLSGTICRFTPPHWLNTYNKFVFLICAIGSFIASYGLKYIILKSNMNVSTHLQLLFPLGVYLFTICMFRFSQRLHYSNKCLNAVDVFFANLTLEIYLVQFLVIEKCMILDNPVRFVMTVFGILLSAFVINKIVSMVISFAKRIPMKKIC